MIPPTPRPRCIPYRRSPAATRPAPILGRLWPPSDTSCCRTF
nr:MAG TPA: hypothetical protein [Bacteriophage sp.]